MEIKQYTLNQRVKEEITREILRYLETNKNENTTYGKVWNAVKAVLKGKFTVIQACLQETRKISNVQSNLTPKGVRKRRKLKVSKILKNNKD